MMDVPAKKRVRLSTEVRRQQILDAALTEFTALGFNAASISKIAARAGMSKANLYVHFANKDEIFETLLKDVLQPALGAWQLPPAGASVEHALDAYIDHQYEQMTPQMVSIMKLLISESHRVPELIRRWQDETVLPAHREQQARIDQYVADGALQKTPLTDNFSFIMAPVLYAVICKLIFTPEVAETERQKTRATHRQLIRLLLKAP
ncbi:TetR family transcriptional regulator [Duganella sp. FT80W]|uniref:TetR family transcriptional regulator n=1 Tax=Duganella guangzhouensis TaxID=2666084 RepID=A0A6I2KTR2_9BURK|nr:TetR/AcrR family transcriptional regulator [Duganella guangzhouensis]MRW89345.1 TetR family transcriptional regulator [Duganella guangzhouensis]